MRRVLALLALLTACTPAGKAPIYTSFAEGEIGGPCNSDGDCKSGMCFTTSFAGTNMASVGGYCSKPCSIDAECGGKSLCISYSDTTKFCAAFCDGPTHCRNGYLCRTGKFCDLASFYTINCDPKASGGVCTTAAGGQGGCLREALGDGIVGECIIGCTLPGNCPSGAGCHYYDVATAGEAFAEDPFQGLLCFFNSSSTPVPLNGACSASSDCQTGLNCVTVGIDEPVCLQLCSDSNPECTDPSALCLPFTPAGPFEGCQPQSG
jgi:hypothetical protein